jgi:23S rRNA (cytosine1962-C5)-methyltransferase
MFHGPGDGTGALAEIAIDRYGAGYWVTDWGGWTDEVASAVTSFLASRGAQHAVVLKRPDKGVPSLPERILGSGPERFEVREGKCRFWIRLEGTRHPGLFLDHAPLRRWLETGEAGRRILNTFAYTGSLSVAAGVGGAEHVTTLDLSRPTVQWAEENWHLNQLDASRARFIYGDVFEWFPRLKKQGGLYDCVILDPPSFSRGEKGSFSTGKDLTRLHRLALSVLAPGGTLITSINSANVSWQKYERDIDDAARAEGRELDVLFEIALPETYPTRAERDRYLKGWALKAR